MRRDAMTTHLRVVGLRTVVPVYRERLTTIAQNRAYVFHISELIVYFHNSANA